MPNSYLVLYLKRARLISGSLIKPTRHSDLSIVKSFILGDKIVAQGYKAYNNFGSAVHHKFLLEKDGKFKLTPKEKTTLRNMMLSLNSNVIVKKLMQHCTIREKRRGAKLHGVNIRFTPDAHGVRIVIDLKTTACSTLQDFIDKAFEYGYFRQGETYSLALGGMEEYWIIGIGKNPPYPVFLVHINSHKEKMLYVKEELKFLLYFYKHYGNPKKQKVQNR